MGELHVPLLKLPLSPHWQGENRPFLLGQSIEAHEGTSGISREHPQAVAPLGTSPHHGDTRQDRWYT